LRQTAGWIKTALGMEVGLGPGHIVLDGDPALLHKMGYCWALVLHFRCNSGTDKVDFLKLLLASLVRSVTHRMHKKVWVDATCIQSLKVISRSNRPNFAPKWISHNLYHVGTQMTQVLSQPHDNMW